MSSIRYAKWKKLSSAKGARESYTGNPQFLPERINSLHLFGNPEFDLIIYTDGGARNNPGHAGIGAILQDPATGKTLIKIKKYIGKTTNNCAEYIAVLESLKEAIKLNVKNVNILSDSELLVKQMQGIYKIKDEKLKKLNSEIKTLSEYFETTAYKHIRRKENSEADNLVNQAINEFLKEKGTWFNLNIIL